MSSFGKRTGDSQLARGIVLVGLGMKEWIYHAPRTDGHVVAVTPDGHMFKAFSLDACKHLFQNREDELQMASSMLGMSRAETMAFIASQGHVNVNVKSPKALYEALHIKLLPPTLTPYVKDKFAPGFEYVDRLIKKHMPEYGRNRDALLQLAEYLSGLDGCCIPASYVYTLANPAATLRAARLGFVVPPETKCLDWEYDATEMIKEAVHFQKRSSARAPFSHLVM
jgi:hypothetical protein